MVHKKRINFLLNFYLILLYVLSISNFVNAHEVRVKDLTIYHPSLFIEKEGAGEGFFSVSNEGVKSDYIVGFFSEFSEFVELYEFNENTNTFDEMGFSQKRYLDLKLKPLEIAPEEAIVFDSLHYLLIFREIDKNLNWFDDHKAVIFFKNSGQYVIEFEVEKNE